MLHLCSKCLAETNFKGTCTENDRRFNLYLCPNCDSVTRDFLDAPQTEREVVEDALWQESHSATTGDALTRE